MFQSNLVDTRIPQYVNAIHLISAGQHVESLPITPADEVGQLGQALTKLVQIIQTRQRETEKISQITSHINAGLLLDEILENVYADFRELIPYNRIGFSVIDEDGQRVRARWAKSDQSHLAITRGYSAPLQGSSLQKIIQTQKPRIINDLEKYARQKPNSESTQLILSEGIRSSLTCPLVANGVPIGFIFFSSTQPHAYAHAHIRLFQQISAQLAITLEKGRLVSKIVDQQAEIDQQNKELQKLNQLKNHFLGMAAHDLRNPLSSIQMAAEVLLFPLNESLESEQQGLLNLIQDQAHYMANLLNDLLDVAQIESGHLSLNREWVIMRDFLRDGVSRYTSQAAKKKITLSLNEIDDGCAGIDPTRLRQAVDNLISNAVKYSPAGSCVTVRGLRDGGGWRIEVQDEGPGINEEDKKRLFQDFTRLSAQPTGGEKSTGLGLAIVRRIIQAHGGTLGVNSKPGEGSTFWFSVPCDSSEAAQSHTLANPAEPLLFHAF